MANDCDYKVRISGEPEDVKNLFDKLQIKEVQENGSLNSTNYELLFESIDDVEDWGSKWQVFSNIDYSEGDTMVFIDGYSAWGPAEGLWQKISKDFNLNVICEYCEGGMNIAGILTWNDGVETDREEMTYWEYLMDNDYEYFWENIGYQCEFSTLDEIKDTLGDVYTRFSVTENERLEELHTEKYVD